MSANQLAAVFGIELTSPVNHAWTVLGVTLDGLRSERVVDLAINRNAPKKEDGVVGLDTYVYYLKAQTDELVRKGVLSGTKKTIRGMDLMAQAAALGVARFSDEDLDRFDAIARANFVSDEGEKA